MPLGSAKGNEEVPWCLCSAHNNTIHMREREREVVGYGANGLSLMADM